MNRKLNLFIVLTTLSIILFTLQNCKTESDEKPEPEEEEEQETTLTPVSKSDKCSPDTVYFIKEVLPIVTANCAYGGCHDNGTKADGVDLSSYDQILSTGGVVVGKASESKLYTVLVASSAEDRMPLGKPALQESSINAVRIWINQGALNNDCENKCDSTDLSFSNSIWPIISSTCQGCHSGGGAGGGVRITNYSQVKDMVDNGSLQGTINHTGNFKPMPPGGQLDSCALAQVNNWIKEGAKDN